MDVIFRDFASLVCYDVTILFIIQASALPQLAMRLLIYTVLCISIEAFVLFRQRNLREYGTPVRSTLFSNNLDKIRDDGRRNVLSQFLLATSFIYSVLPLSSQANVGKLPELFDTNVILQGITIRVADQSQQKAMIQFLEDGFDFEVLRKRIVGSLEETWLGFGPEQLSVPSDFQAGVSSFAKYGGHASIHLVYDAQEVTPFYRTGENVPGNNVAYLQVAVPGYRISQMVKNGGNILDAYGYVSAVSPSGLPIRGIVGIAPDPIMFIAINCVDVKKSREFYERLGFVEQEYPYSRPNKGLGQFEPLQPEKSVYLAPSDNCMGVLLLQSREKRITPNPAVQSLNLVFTPAIDSMDNDDTENSGPRRLIDPSGISIAFQPVSEFGREEVATR
jgi:hypothetical protein